MAYKVSKRKLPLREDKQVHEINKIAGRVFDRMTLSVLVRMLNAGIFRSLLSHCQRQGSHCFQGNY